MKKDALYIKHNGRPWCVWQDGRNILHAIPQDEEEYDEEDIAILMDYLFSEGFFPDFFEDSN